MFKFKFSALRNLTSNLRLYLTCLSAVILVAGAILSLSSSITLAQQANDWYIERMDNNDLNFYLKQNGKNGPSFVLKSDGTAKIRTLFDITENSLIPTYFLDPDQDSVLKTLTVTNFTMTGTSNVGIGTVAPQQKLDVRGAAAINGGNLFASANSKLLPGALNIGDSGRDYGGGTGWNGNVAGLFLEAKNDTEIAVHDSAERLASLIHYKGGPITTPGNNKITVGRDMGWGAIASTVLNGNIGIGDSNPLSKLRVYDSKNINGPYVSDNLQFESFNPTASKYPVGQTGLNLDVSTNGGGGITSLVAQQVTYGPYWGPITYGYGVLVQPVTRLNYHNMDYGWSFLANTPYIAANSSITRLYGFYINPQKVAGVTYGYGIYQAGASDINHFDGQLEAGGLFYTNSNSNPIQFNSGHTGYVNSAANRAEIANDTVSYKTLMLLGNSSGGLGRRVSVWDRFEVNGVFVNNSSKERKKDIVELNERDFDDILTKIETTPLYHYHFKQSGIDQKQRLGVIAEESPSDILDETGKAVSMLDYLGFLFAGLKIHNKEIANLKEIINKQQVMLENQQKQLGEMQKQLEEMQNK